MSWQGVHGHDRQLEWFRQQYANGRVGSSYLFVGPSGIGKRMFAMKLAQAFLCEQPVDVLVPCDQCPGCQQVKARTHPDLLTLSRHKDRTAILIEQLVGRSGHRMREGLCYDISLKPYCGGKRIAIIDDADDFNLESANALLKTLEEPPPYAIMILVGTSKERQVPTILSRCQVLRFAPLGMQVVADLLREHGHVADGDQAKDLARLAGGSMEKAISLVDSGVMEFCDEFFFQLANRSTNLSGLVSLVNDFVEEAGDDVSKDLKSRYQRRRLQYVLELTADFYRQLMRKLAGVDSGQAGVGNQTVSATADHWPGNVENALACINCCLESSTQAARNVNQKALVEHWLDRLQQLSWAQDPVGISLFE